MTVAEMVRARMRAVAVVTAACGVASLLLLSSWGATDPSSKGVESTSVRPQPWWHGHDRAELIRRQEEQRRYRDRLEQEAAKDWKKRDRVRKETKVYAHYFSRRKATLTIGKLAAFGGKSFAG